MRKTKTKTVSSTKFTVKENRLIRKTILRVKKIKTAAEMLLFEGAVMRMKAGRLQHIILLATVSTRRVKAKLDMPAAEWDFHAKSVAMQKAIKANELDYFTPAFAGLGVWETNNTNFSDAIIAVEKKVGGAPGVKKAALIALNVSLDDALGYINSKSRANQTMAEAYIGAALMTVINSGTRTVSDITVKLGKAAKSLECKCPAAKIDNKRVAAAYEKGYSTDGGTTWTDLVSNPKCKAVVTDLDTALQYIFRSRYTYGKDITTKYVYSSPISPQ